MYIAKLAIIWIICMTGIVSAQYECTYDDGSVKEVSRAEANECEDCECKVIMVECLFGPDSRGDFSFLNVTKTAADSCDKTACVCASHGVDYNEIAAQRREEAYDKVGKLKDEI